MGKRLIKPSKMTKAIYECDEINNLKELIERSYKKYKDNIAFKFKDEKGNILQKTYEDFKTDIDYIGTAFSELGLNNSKVVLIGKNRYEWCTTYFATINGSNTIIPLDKMLPDDEIRNLIDDSRPEVIICEEKYIKLFEKLKQEFKEIKSIICIDSNENVMDFNKLLEIGKKALENGNKKFVENVVDDNQTNIMIYTSGTTSKSKAVLLTPKNLASDVVSCAKVLKFYEKETLLSFLPIHHTFECTATFLLGMYSGASIAFCDGMKSIVPNLKEYNVNVFLAVPLILEVLYKGVIKNASEKGIPAEMVLKSMAPGLRLFVVGAASIDKKIVVELNKLGITAYQGYGLTEASPVVSVENDRQARPGSIGRLLPGIEGMIDNPDEEGVGEILIKGKSVMKGYYNKEKETADALKDGWLHTGDLGYFDEDDFLYITGRKKSVIVLKNGKNVYPEELEAVINNCPYIMESFVYPTNRKNDSEQLCAKIVYNKEYFNEKHGNISDDEKKGILLEHVKVVNKNLPMYKYIRDITVTNEPLIKTTTNKIKRYEELKKIN